MDDTTPATKADITPLKEALSDLRAQVRSVQKAFHDETESWATELHEAMEAWKDEIKRDFDDAIRVIREDLRGAHRDRFQQLREEDQDLDRRVDRLECRVGILD